MGKRVPSDSLAALVPPAGGGNIYWTLSPPLEKIRPRRKGKESGTRNLKPREKDC